MRRWGWGWGWGLGGGGGGGATNETFLLLDLEI